MFIPGKYDSPFWMTLHIRRQNHRTNLNHTPSRSVCRLCMPVAPCCQPAAPLVLDLDAKQAGNKRRACATATATLPPRQRPCCPPLVVNVKQADNEHQACAATVTTTITLFVIASVAFPLDVDAKQSDDEHRICVTAARRCRRSLQIRDHGSIPTIR